MPNYELEMAESVIAGRELKILELEAEITRLTAEHGDMNVQNVKDEKTIERLTAIEVAARVAMGVWFPIGNENPAHEDLELALAADKPIEDDK